MDYKPSPVQRAFEIAKSGKVATVSDIVAVMRKEGYSIESIVGPMLRKQLRTTIKDAQNKDVGRDPPNGDQLLL